MKVFAGIDIGSTAIKVALTDEAGHILSRTASPTGGLFRRNASRALDEAISGAGLSAEDIVFTVSTGYGRKIFKEADDTVSEITANAVGASRSKSSSGRVRTVINIGGQDLKVIRLDADGHVEDFTMNDKCAAGTGRFLEMTARNLEIDVDQLGEMHLSEPGVPVTINSTCTVFAESEIISLLAAGEKRGRIAAGIHYAIARRVARLALRLGVDDVIFFDGGPAANQGLVAAIEDELMRPLVIPEMPQHTTAYGAAVLARQIWSSSDAMAAV